MAKGSTPPMNENNGHIYAISIKPHGARMVWVALLRAQLETAGLDTSFRARLGNGNPKKRLEVQSLD